MREMNDYVCQKCGVADDPTVVRGLCAVCSRQREEDTYWSRVERAAVALRAALGDSIGNETWVVNEAEDLIREIDRRREQE